MCFDICTINIGVSIRVRGLHLVFFRSPGGILVLGFGLEIPRFVQGSWGNLGSWFLVLAENAF